MRREERDLHPMAKAFQLITLLKGLKIAELSEPRLTAEWEQKLRLIEEGKFQSDEFMREIRRLTENVVNMAKQYEGNSVPLENPRRIEAPLSAVRRRDRRKLPPLRLHDARLRVLDCQASFGPHARTG